MQDSCWLWAGQTNGCGYGVIREKGRGKRHRAHRVIYENMVGEIPKGLVIDHLCRVTMCINPDHLEAVTQKENNLRGVGFMAQNARKTHCPQGHPYSGNNVFHRKIKNHVGRYCRTCLNFYSQRWRNKQKLLVL